MLEAAVKLRHIKRFILISIDCDIVASYTCASAVSISITVHFVYPHSHPKPAGVFPFCPAYISVCLKGKDGATPSLAGRPLFLQF
jgi:hypothetical protein